MFHDDHRKFAVGDKETETPDDVSRITAPPGVSLDTFWAVVDSTDRGEMRRR